MAWTVVNFGKYKGKGKTLPQIVFADPDWFFWAVENDAFAGKGSLAAEAKLIAARARTIRIPGEPVGQSKVRYYVHPPTEKLGNIEVVPASRGPHHGSSPTRDSPYFDMSMPRKIAPYDKTGGKFMIGAVKHHVFGNAKTRLTKDLCEGFFNEPSNFG